MRLVLQIMLLSIMFTETSGERTCWYHRKTRKGEECKGKMWRFSATIARYVGGTTNSWEGTRHWSRINRKANGFCACPLPVHSADISANIPARFYEMFDRIGRKTSGYRPGVRWCSSCRRKKREKVLMWQPITNHLCQNRYFSSLCIILDATYMNIVSKYTFLHFYKKLTEEMDLRLREETKKCSTLQTQLNLATQQLAEMKGIFTVSKLLSITT